MKSACLAALACVLALSGTAHAQRVAFTFDDGPTTTATPLLSPLQRNAAILDALARYQVKAVLYVTCGNGANTPAGLELARAWGTAGHVLGNHTMTHIDLNSDKVTLGEYQQQILECDKIIAPLPGYRKWFRYTYINEGNTAAKRDGMRAFLAQQGYRDAPVTFHVSDWTVDDQLMAALQANPAADIAPIKAAYLADVRKRALDSHAKAVAAQRGEQTQILLLHHNLANALWLGDVLEVFKSLGWKSAVADDSYTAR